MIDRPPENKAVKAPLTARVAAREPEKVADVSACGYCPRCGAECVERERRPDGNDMCANGHVYPSKSAVSAPGPSPLIPAPRAVGHGSCPRCGVVGTIYVEGAGVTRKIIHGGCICPKKP